MLTYVFGLISPEALTTEDKSWRWTLPVCTVTTFLPLWWTVKPTIAAKTTTTPTPIATFFQVFIVPVQNYRPAGPATSSVAGGYFRDSLADTYSSAGMTGTHSGIRSCGQESSNLEWSAETLGIRRTGACRNAEL